MTEEIVRFQVTKLTLMYTRLGLLKTGGNARVAGGQEGWGEDPSNTGTKQSSEEWKGSEIR